MAEVSETPRTRPRDATDEPEFDYRSACAYLLTIPHDLQAAAITAAEKQLGPDTKNETLRIRAAEIAAKGVPA